MKKPLNTNTVMNELRGQSVFFPRPSQEQPDQTDHVSPELAQLTPPSAHDTVISRHHDTMTPRHHDTIPSSPADPIEAVRKAVRHIGKEAATHRFTIEEKQALAEIEFLYRKKGIKTSENEITRIAIHLCINEYHTHGEESLLAKVLNSLNT